MNVKGEHQFEVSAQQLWNYLMDIEVLAKITPGVSKLEVLEKDKYKTVSEIKIGPVKGSFKGDLEVVDKAEPNSFVIKMEQLSKIGNAHVKVDMLINQNGEAGSTLSFDGKAKLSGVIARTGQRVLSGVANKITKEVFASLDEHIAEDQKKNGVIKEPSSAEKTTEQKSTDVAKEEKQISAVKPLEVPAKDELEAKVKESVQTVSSSASDQVNKVSSSSVLHDTVGEATDKPEGFFTSIINFFKRLFS